MVDDINFPKGLPPVSATNRVGKVKRKLRDEDRPPFKQILEPEDQKEKEKKKEKKDDKRDPAGKKNKGSINNSSLQPDSKSTEDAEAGSIKKIIDVRV
jgi:hypothetical protein